MPSKTPRGPLRDCGRSQVATAAEEWPVSPVGLKPLRSQELGDQALLRCPLSPRPLCPSLDRMGASISCRASPEPWRAAPFSSGLFFVSFSVRTYISSPLLLGFQLCSPLVRRPGHRIHCLPSTSHPPPYLGEARLS